MCHNRASYVMTEARVSGRGSVCVERGNDESCSDLFGSKAQPTTDLGNEAAVARRSPRAMQGALPGCLHQRSTDAGRSDLPDRKHAANPLPAWHGFGYKATMMPTLGINGPCEFLREGRCSIYDDRPAVCREYGHKVLTLDCGHDCQPSRPFTNEAASAIMLLMSYVLDIQGAMAVVIPRDSELVFRHLQESVDNLCVDVEMEDGEEISASGNSVTPEPNSVMPCNARDGTLRSHKGL